MDATVHRPREVESLVTGLATSDGAGVKLTRVLTQNLQRRLDPFLMLDAFGSDVADDYIAGFPDHPHRGFETVTYMLEGRMRHRDSAGNEGLLESGGMQWMTAGRGVIHSELPEQEEGRMEGFQLWLNLPARDKMRPAWYRDVGSADIPLWQGPGQCVRVLAGAHEGVNGAMQREVTEPRLLDVHLEQDTEFVHALPAHFNAFLYVYRGDVRFASGCAVPSQRMAVLKNDAAADGVQVKAGPQGARFLLVAGVPLHEPIAQHGPFVMNTEAELVQAVRDFRSGRFVAQA